VDCRQKAKLEVYLKHHLSAELELSKKKRNLSLLSLPERTERAPSKVKVEVVPIYTRVSLRQLCLIPALSSERPTHHHLGENLPCDDHKNDSKSISTTQLAF
jgi:hypothetical protein